MEKPFSLYVLVYITKYKIILFTNNFLHLLYVIYDGKVKYIYNFSCFYDKTKHITVRVIWIIYENCHISGAYNP